MFALTYTVPESMTIGDVSRVFLQLTNQRVSNSILIIDEAISSPANCTASSNTPMRQALMPPGSMQVFDWSVSADKPGICMLDFKTTIAALPLVIVRPIPFSNADRFGFSELVILIGAICSVLATLAGSFLAIFLAQRREKHESTPKKKIILS